MIVADSGPLNYLVLINRSTLLALLFKKVLIPHEVSEELQHERTPSSVRAWMKSPPPWLTVVAPRPRIVEKAGLHTGELAAIELAERIGLQTLLIDDQRGKQEAIRRGLPVIGTVGVLYESAMSGLIDFEVELTALLSTNFRLSPVLQTYYLDRWKAFRPTGYIPKA